MKAKVLVLLFAIMCFVVSNIYASEVINYSKSGREVVVSFDSIPQESVVLIAGQYSDDEKKLIKAELIDIKEHSGSYSSKTFLLADGYRYKFFVWDSIENMMPLYMPLTLTSATLDGAGDSTNAGFDGDSYEDDIFDD